MSATERRIASLNTSFDVKIAAARAADCRKDRRAARIDDRNRLLFASATPWARTVTWIDVISRGSSRRMYRAWVASSSHGAGENAREVVRVASSRPV